MRSTNWGEVVGQLESAAAPPAFNGGRSSGRPAATSEASPPAFSAAPDISDTGKVTGFMYPSGQQHAFLYDADSDRLTDLGVLPRRTVSFGNGVNNAGQVAGNSHGGSRPQHAFRYTPGVGMVDLGTFNGDSGSTAAAINNAGHVVGRSTYSGLQIEEHAFLYTDAHKMLRLVELVATPGRSRPQQPRPRAVNDYPGHAFGQIGGTAVVNGEFRVFLLTPDR